MLGEALLQDEIYTCGVVIAELLQGSRTVKERHALLDTLTALPYCPWHESDWPAVGELANTLRMQGLTVPLMDVMVAFLALRANAIVLHVDRHYELLVRQLPLKTRSFS